MTAKPQLLESYDGQRLAVRQAKADSIGTVPLSPSGNPIWMATWNRESYKVKYSILPVPVHLPLSSESGREISYDGIRKVVEAIERNWVGLACPPVPPHFRH